MSFKFNDIFKIPERNVIQQKLTKAFFLRIQGITSAEKKVLNTAILKMDILAQIIPEKSNIPALTNNTESFEQILLIICRIRDNEIENDADKCIQLIQKYISHQVIIIIEDSNEFKINVTEKRVNQNDKTKLTVEKYITTNTIPKLYKNDLNDIFFKALDFAILDKTNLAQLYKNYIQVIIQYKTSAITGSFKKRTNTRSTEDMQHLETIEQLEKDIISLTSQIKKGSQLNQKVQLNIKIQEKRKAIEKIKTVINEH